MKSGKYILSTRGLYLADIYTRFQLLAGSAVMRMLNELDLAVPEIGG